MKKIKNFEKRVLNSKNYEDFCNRLNCTTDEEVLNKLLKYLTFCFEDQEFNSIKREIVDRVILFAEEIIKEKDIPKMKYVSRISGVKKPFIDRIKAVDKKERPRDKNISFFKDVVNYLESLEVFCLDYVDTNQELVNANLIKYIIFKERNLVVSHNLITQYPHLINQYSLENENILDEATDKFLKYLLLSFSEYKYKSDVAYYNQVIKDLLTTPKIKISNEKIEENIKRVQEKSKQSLLGKKYVTKYKAHLKNLEETLKDPYNYKASEKILSRLYNISINNNAKFASLALNKDIDEKLTFNRRLIDDFTFTVDGEDTTDRDDAISIKKIDNDTYQLGVHIADVSSFLQGKPLLKKEAEKRCSTIYLENGGVSMFPKEIVTDCLSLDEGKTRLAKSYFFDINNKGDIKNFKIENTLIKVDKNYSYEEADNLLAEDFSDNDNYCLKKVNVFASLIRNKLGLSELIFEDSFDNDDLSMKSTSRTMVETCMLVTNKTVAEYFKKYNYPFLYRVFPKDKEIPKDIKMIIDSLNDRESNYYKKLVLRFENLLLHSSYSSQALKHEALRFDAYCHATSPIRRYADVITSDCIDSYYFNKDQGLNIKQLEEKAQYLNARNMDLLEYYKGRALIRKKN